MPNIFLTMQILNIKSWIVHISGVSHGGHAETKIVCIIQKYAKIHQPGDGLLGDSRYWLTVKKRETSRNLRIMEFTENKVAKKGIWQQNFQVFFYSRLLRRNDMHTYITKITKLSTVPLWISNGRSRLIISNSNSIKSCGQMGSSFWSHDLTI